MGIISYNEYPLLLHTSFCRNESVPDIYFGVPSMKEKNFLSESNGFKEMFGLIGVKNTLAEGNSNIHFYLKNDLFRKIDNDQHFRNQQFTSFFKSNIKPKHGVILFPNGGQYIYILLGKEETKGLKKGEGKYIATALFKNNHFIGFEEGCITDQGINIFPTGYYGSGMDRGGYLSFVLITLAYAGDNPHPCVETNVAEKIYQL